VANGSFLLLFYVISLAIRYLCYCEFNKNLAVADILEGPFSCAMDGVLTKVTEQYGETAGQQTQPCASDATADRKESPAALCCCDPKYYNRISEVKEGNEVIRAEELVLSCACTPCRSLVLIDGDAVLAHISRYYRPEDEAMLRNQILRDDVDTDSTDVSRAGWWARRGVVTFAGAYLPHWVLHPMRTDKIVLLQIEEWYSRGHIPAGLQALWMNAIIPIYVQDYSIHSRVFERDVRSGLEALRMDENNSVPQVGDELWSQLYAVRDVDVIAVLCLIADTGGTFHTEVTENSSESYSDGALARTHLVYTTDIKLLDDITRATGPETLKIGFLPKISRRESAARWIKTLGNDELVRTHGSGGKLIQKLDFGKIDVVAAELRAGGFKVVTVSIRNRTDYLKLYLSKRLGAYVWPGLLVPGWVDVSSWHPTSTPFRALKCPLGMRYKWDHYHLQVVPGVYRRSRSRALAPIVAALFPVSSDADRTHTRIYMDEVMNIMLSGEQGRSRKYSELNEALTRLPIGTTTVWATGQLLWHAFTDTAAKVWRDVSPYGLCGMLDMCVARVSKKLENMYRRTARWLSAKPMSQTDLGHAVGMSLMTGRARHVSDWNKERANRCDSKNILKYVHPATKDHQEGLRVLAKKLYELQTYIVDTHKIERKEWNEYVASAQNWLSAGSVGGAKIEYPDLAEHPLPPGTLNKRSFLEHVPASVMKDLLKTTPEVVATASEKFENGKERAIYGTAMVDYLAFGYILSGIDSNMTHMPWCEMGCMGYDRIRGMLKRFHVLRRDGVEAAMGDYADFNRQHMLSALSLRYATLREVLKDKRIYNPEYDEVLVWCQQALLNCYAYFPVGANNRKTYRTVYCGNAPSGARYIVKLPTSCGASQVVQGLFSGHRGTSNDNTTLNIAYVDVASDHVVAEYGVSPHRIHRTHEGDDIYLAVQNRLFAALLYDTLISQGMELQNDKQLYSRRGEFLRLLYGQHRLQGYLCRAVVAWITAPLQNQAEGDIVSRINEARTSAATCYRRGADAHRVTALMDLLISRLNRCSERDEHGESVVAKYPISSLEKGYIVGGIDLGRPGTFPANWHAHGYIPRRADSALTNLTDLPHHISAAQAQRDRSAMDITNAATAALQQMYHEQNFAKCISASSLKQKKSEYVSDLQKWNKTVEKYDRAKYYIPRLRLVPVCSRHEYGKYWVHCPHDDRYDITWRKFIPNAAGWDTSPPDTMLCTIDRAIRASAFRDLTTIQKVKEGSTLALIKYAINSCGNKVLRDNANMALERLRFVLGGSDAARVVAGMRMDGASITWLLPDPILGYLCNVVVEAVVEAERREKQFSVGEWAQLVSYASRCSLSYIAKSTDWMVLGYA